MALPIGPTVGILADNLRRRGSVLPISTAAATGWARGLDLPHGGETVIYTGGMYQLIPFITAMGRTQERLADSPLAPYAGLGRLANRVVNLSALMARPGRETRRDYDRVLAAIARLLQRSGLDFGYLYEDELYSGALVYDLGVDHVLAPHARRVAAALRRHGVRRLITVDPHTTHMLASVYPRLVDGFDFEVRSYLEVLAEAQGAGRGPGAEAGPAEHQFGGPGSQRVVIHDSCLYARSMGVLDEPRRLLAGAGVTVIEPDHTGRFTWCCGGPVESLYPRKAHAAAERRLAQLRAVAGMAGQVVTMCPLCLVNLRRVAGDGLKVNDISDYLTQGGER